MSLSHRLQKIREKPARVKNRIALTWVGIIGGCIVIVWIVTFNFKGFNLRGVRGFFQATKTYFSQPHKEIFDADTPGFFQANSTPVSTSTIEVPTASSTSTSTASSTIEEKVQ